MSMFLTRGIVVAQAFALPTWLIVFGIGFGITFFIAAVALWLTTRYISNEYVGIVEKLWSTEGSVKSGFIIALHDEAGYQAELLRGGLHFGLWRWQYRVRKTRLITIPQGKIGYVYSRDGAPLAASQTLGRMVECMNFQDAQAFLVGKEHGQPMGQRGRQAGILREGVYAINLSLFVVVTETMVHTLSELMTRREGQSIASWQKELLEIDGFSPVIVVKKVEVQSQLNEEDFLMVDSMGIVTVHDGPSLSPGEIIAPIVGGDTDDPNFHNNFQNPEEFLAAGGRRGRQFQTLIDGTYFINRWFATVEIVPKTVVPIGYVGVVVSYHGQDGQDVSGVGFRHGERVADGFRGVCERPLGPGKYAFNTYAGNIILVPTTNFVLHWITGRTETHRYDENLKSIDLVTRDAYEPRLPLSVVVHIDYQRAPNVIQRFGDVSKLITQTLDPLLSAYFRDVAHRKTMLELLHERDVIQAESRAALQRKFREFDIECVDVLIGKPETGTADSKIEVLLEQLRTRQLSFEQLETYQRQCAASEQLRLLNEARAQAEMQTQLTNARVRAQIAESEGEAELAMVRKHAEKAVVMSEAELAQSRRKAEQTLVLAEANSQREILAGRGEGQRILQAGLATASVLARKVSSYGDPRLYALAQVGARLSQSSQPLVPERLFISGGGTGEAGNPQSMNGMVGLLLQMLLADKSTFQPSNPANADDLQGLVDQLTKEAKDNLNKTQPTIDRVEVVSAS